MVMNRLEAASHLPENQGDSQQLAIEQARGLLISAGVKDPGLRTETLPLRGDQSQTIVEHLMNSFSPEILTKFWRAKLQADGKRAGLDISVPDCNWTREEIERPMMGIKGNKVPSMMVYIPQELMGQGGLVKLGHMYPRINSMSIRDDTDVQDSHDANKEGGWIKVEATLNAPNLNSTQGQLEEHAKRRGCFIQRVNVYILASQARKDLAGRYLDEKSTYSRLGSCMRGVMVNAKFHPDGDMDVNSSSNPRDHNKILGGRFEEIRKLNPLIH